MNESSRERSSGVPEPGWVAHAIWWQLYPLGFVGAFPADPAPTPGEHRLRRIVGWLDHAVSLGASGLALGPIFASRTHGYDTTDHLCVDPRLGDDADFDHLVAEAHRRGLRILLDGVFNHVGTDFAQYRSGDDGWFRPQGNGFHTFEGHDELITLNHGNPDVVDYTIEVIKHWLRRGADGWRLDAAYAMPGEFWAQVLPQVRLEFPDAWFVGEVLHGDYSAQLQSATFDSVTQYELWKAVWSSLNDGNFFELDWALQRHNDFLDTFVPMTFIGNHDVTRIASQLSNPRHLEHAVVLLLTTGGTPSVYAGDEFGMLGVKEERFGGDDAIRPEFGSPPDQSGDGLRLHQHLIGLRRRHPWLHTARTSAVRVTNSQYVFRTWHGSDALVVALNIGADPLRLALSDAGCHRGEVIAGSGAPPRDAVADVEVAPDGWMIIQPA